MNIPITDSSMAARNVVATAIDGETLILKDIESGDHIYWPLKSIPHPLTIGTNMCLELKNTDTSSINNRHPGISDADDTHKLQLLEELIN